MRGKLQTTLVTLVSLAICSWWFSSCGMSEAVNARIWNVVYGPESRSQDDYPGSLDLNIGNLQPFNFPEGWSTYPVLLAIDPNWSAEQRDLLVRAIQHWNQALGFEALAVSPDEPPPMAGVASILDLGEDGVNGLYSTQDWQFTMKPDRVLASTFSRPSRRADHLKVVESDIFFNVAHYNLTDIYNPEHRCLMAIDLYHLALHEFGHLLGLGHVRERDSIMQPILTPGFIQPQRRVSDLDIQRIYFTAGLAAEPPAEGEQDINPEIVGLEEPQWYQDCALNQ